MISKINYSVFFPATVAVNIGAILKHSGILPVVFCVYSFSIGLIVLVESFMYVSIAVIHLTFSVTLPILHPALVVTTTLVIKVRRLILFLIRLHFALFERPHIPILLAPVGPSQDS